ncbi:MAG: cobyric acid synthase CobQ [Spirochaetae bacterium HGW-Spirochaetae-5]|nr:MAG: cobyric acid synthase CobQ [Spirochaetae bacterium HGW-Spirochaetae-5]
MIQGTASSVGKSMITAALCRIFAEDGRSVAPYKSQNMALNSFVTKEGHEMGRAQTVQAAACFREPSVLMNPVLLKPSSDTGSQVIVMGRVHGNMNAAEYQKFKPELKQIVLDAYRRLESGCDVIVIEGAGSPAEINLRENDIVNMGMAELVDAPVILVADIDRGGVFASVVGTIFLLKEDEKKRVKGVIINKFRGDIDILMPGIRELESIINIPVLGVVPYADIKLEDEDSVTERFIRKSKNSVIDICVIKTPWISNFTDFDVFDHMDDVNLRYATSAAEIGEPHMLIIPGSKNTIADMIYIREKRIDTVIYSLHEKGVVIAGICGGYQMMGSRIDDPYSVESESSSCRGLGLTSMETVLEREKITTQVNGTVVSDCGIMEGLKALNIKGYEIHMGRSSHPEGLSCFTETENGKGGIVSGNLFGTYIHGIFDSIEFTGGLLNNIRRSLGIELKSYNTDYTEMREKEFEKLAQLVRGSVDMKKVYRILDRDDTFC